MVLIARAKAPAKLAKAVKAAKGEVHEFEAPKAREMPRALVADAQRLGFRLEPGRRPGPGRADGRQPGAPRATSWSAWRSGPGRAERSTAADLDAMVSDTSEAVVWALSDALLERDPAGALAIAERLIAQGENVTGLIYGLASRLRKACAAGPAREGCRQAGRASPACTPTRPSSWSPPRQRRPARGDDRLADLEVWCRGGADYGDELALTLALRRAAGVPA